MARVDANAHRRESPSRARVEFDGARARATTHRARERGRASDANARTHARWHATRGIGRATRDDDDRWAIGRRGDDDKRGDDARGRRAGDGPRAPRVNAAIRL
jgi:hypothetical protein